MKSILDPAFKYIPSVETDIRKTFARIRREQQKGATFNATAPQDRPAADHSHHTAGLAASKDLR
jgi:hypothetical protein